MATNRSTKPKVRPVQRCACRTSVRKRMRLLPLALARVRARMKGCGTADTWVRSVATLPSLGMDAPQRGIDEAIGVGIGHAHRLVLRIGLGEHAPLELRPLLRHAPVGLEHRDLLFEYLEVVGAILAHEVGRYNRRDLVRRSGVAPLQ